MMNRNNSFRSLAFAGLGVSAIACADSAGPDQRHPPPIPGIHVLQLETYDRSGQAVHPDPASTPLSWGGSATQLVATPYPGGDATKENPSLYSGASLTEWAVPGGVINPIARPADGYLSDPDEVYNPETGEIWIYYRHVNFSNDILLIRASEPKGWSAPTLVVSAPNHEIVSPTVVRRAAADWLMWAVNSGSSGCVSQSTTVELRNSADGIHWSSPTAVDLHEDGVFPWHIDVEWIPSRNEFWAVYNVKVPGSCTTSELHFAASPDGLHWTPAVGPVLRRGSVDAFADIVYRASLLYDAQRDMITLFYSGARYVNGAYDWRVATELISRADLFDRLTTAPPLGGASPSQTRPLTNADAP